MRYFILCGWIANFFLCLATPLPALNLNEREEFGYLLSTKEKYVLWWAEGTYKIGKKYEPPSRKRDCIQISAAKREYEPFQLVIYAKRDLEEISVKVSDLKNPKGETISKNNIEIDLVEYVNVKIPSDAIEMLVGTEESFKQITRLSPEIAESAGWWPDPLPPYINPFNVERENNQPIWITVYVPEDAVAGIYEGEIEIIPANAKPTRVKLKVRIFDFVLPEITHTRTAYGLSINTHFLGLKEREDIEKVWDLYLQNFAKHRVAPYNPMKYWPVKWELHVRPEDSVSEGKVWESSSTVKFDFEDFDKAAHKYLADDGIYRFNAFRFGRIPARLEGQERFTPEFNELYRRIYGPIFDHLREKGWLDKCYCYWIDEPGPDKYELVKQGMDLLKTTCPQVRRLLTIFRERCPTPRLYDYVDIWVPQLFMYDERRAKQRQELGEEVWWYVCGGPEGKQPYPYNFLDYPAMKIRMRFWMMEKYGVTGDLYWQTARWGYKYRKYPDWTPPIAGEYHNPWKDPMSYSFHHSKVRYLGNGEACLLYPAVREPSAEPVIAGPVNSIRWELTREGLEDKEYFWLLQQEVNRLKVRGESSLKKFIEMGEEALALPDELVESLKKYETDPLVLYQAREKVARAIEQLTKK